MTIALHTRVRADRAPVVVQTVTLPGETPELLALAAADDLIAGVVGWRTCSPARPPASTASERWDGC